MAVLPELLAGALLLAVGVSGRRILGRRSS
jgi:hypothetical protein